MKRLAIRRLHLSYVVSFVVFFLLLIPAFLLIDYVEKQVQKKEMDKNTRSAEESYRLLQSLSKDFFDYISKKYVSNKGVQRALELALEGKEAEARTLLFRLLYEEYEELRDMELIWELQFALPNNISLIRFHAVNIYGDDLSSLRTPIVIANKTKKAHYGFGLGRTFVGIRFAYPIISPDGRHLGAVEISRPTHLFRREFLQISPEGDLILLINSSLLRERVSPAFIDMHYSKFPWLDGWHYVRIKSEEEENGEERVGTTCPLTGEIFSLPKDVLLKEEFKELLPLLGSGLQEAFRKKGNTSILVEKDGKLYAVGLVKLYEPEKDVVLAVLLTFSRSESLELASQRFNLARGLAFWGAIMFSILVFMYARKVEEATLAYQKLRTISATMGSGLFMVDRDEKIRFVNEAGASILGYTREELMGKSINEILCRYGKDVESCSVYRAIIHGENFSGDETLMTKGGRVVDVHVDLRHMTQDGIYEGAVIVISDITERKKMEMELYRLATTDSLTGLYNRSYAMEELRKAKERSDRYGEEFSVVLIDADNFKKINDTYGHDVGDKVLIAIVNTIKNNIRAVDIPVRWGGEELLVIMPHTQLKDAVSAAERIRSQVETLRVGDVENVTVSAGVATHRRGESINKIIKRADEALYTAKRTGKNRVVSEEVA
ncbi:MAG: sensor domain-containing diguanylate cyclase [Aquificaceae bacterium]|nr:sensor domain-containing diguanylate cyclase [Aquificaceae bacterium]